MLSPSSLLLLLLWTSSSYAQTNNTGSCSLNPFTQYTSPASQTVCLNMIVKNESKVIERALASVLPIIDYWVIVDTGSTDGTQQIIKDYWKQHEVDGELHERPWVNFGHNRQEALELVEHACDYVLFLDADEVVTFKDGVPALPLLEEDAYDCWRGTSTFSYATPQIVRGGIGCRWEGVAHEYILCPGTVGRLDNLFWDIEQGGGARSQDMDGKLREYVKLLTEGLKKEPNNSRYAFYLANSYNGLREFADALEWYVKRAGMGGGEEEIFIAKFQAAQMMDELDFDFLILEAAYLDAHEYRPHRSEPVYYLVNLYFINYQYDKGCELLDKYLAMKKPEHKDITFNFEWIDEYGLLEQRAVCAYIKHDFKKAVETADHLLNMENVPESVQGRMIAYRPYFEQYPMDMPVPLSPLP